ncbi:uncharacterized protein LOC132560589 [Ylistrum balloti]|uniref:uncharacterized protein LOC132560589 n=1 Tax=Ylistrum balloti TaxID=509963 RepID=UPI002905E73A|nr:uncharacterized protein LOC132560589 [Ylistrum balloti]
MAMLSRVTYSRVVAQLSRTFVISLRTLHGGDRKGCLRIRPTTADDYDGVVSIRDDINRGFDYIPGTYHELLKYNTGYGGFIDSNLVAFLFGAVIDDGRTIAMQSGRVKRGYEGQGITSEMKEHCLMNLSKTATKSVIVISSQNTYNCLIEKNVQLLCKMERLAFSASRQSLYGQCSTRGETSCLKRADSDFMKNLFLDPKTTSVMFPGNRIVIRGTPYDLVTSNIDRIMCCSDQILVSRRRDTDGVNFMSITSTWRCNTTTVLYINLFGERADESIISQHVHMQIARILSSCEENIVLYVTSVMQHHLETIKRVLEKHSWIYLEGLTLFAIEKSFRNL